MSTNVEAPQGVAQPVDVLVAQCGAQPWQREGGGERLAAWIEPELERQPADLVVLSELATTPFFSVAIDRDWLTAGETLDSPGMSALARLAQAASTHILVPFCERGGAGELYNAAALFGPDGKPLLGTTVTGPRRGEPASTYRKVHLSENNNTDPGVHEKYYFRPGDGFVVWDTPFGRLGILICYDRSFPEAWRAVRLAGASIVAIPVASSRPERAALFARELELGAVYNGVFAIGACKGGGEELADGNGSITYFGASQIVSPMGESIAQGPLGEGPAFVRAQLDPALLETHERTYHLMRDRRPDAY